MAKYAYEDNPQLSPHFCAREFRCKCSSPHTFQVSEQLISMLEQLYAALDCGKIIVNSGYRCAAHDKAVGGNGAGQHTKGTAADVVCYGELDATQPVREDTMFTTSGGYGFYTAQ